MSTPTTTIFRTDAFTVLGHAIRTTDADSIEDIPALWARIGTERLLDDVPGRLDDAVYAVYTDLQHAGENRDGWFTFLIGVRVDPSVPVPSHLRLATIPTSNRMRFPAPEHDAAQIISAWQAAWAAPDEHKTFLCEHERYAHDDVSVNLGIV